MNRMKNRDYQEIKNQAFVVISFRDGVRVLTRGNLPAHTAIHEVIENTERGFVSLMFEEGNLPSSCDFGCSRRIDDFLGM